MELVEASTLPPAAFAALVALYEDRFPDELRAPFDDLMRDSVAVLITPSATPPVTSSDALDHTPSGTPGGFAVTRPLGPTGWVFLRYYAVASRGQGVGSQLWKALLQRWADAGFTHVMLDVEDPDEPGTSPAEVEIRHRRIAFYQRLGVQLLPVREYEPPHDGEPHRLLLLAAPTAADGSNPPTRAVVEAVYQYRYGLAPTDPAVQRTVRDSGI